MRVLGINAVFHDPAAPLVVDARIVAVAEEVAQALAEDRIMAWFQGRSEYGPRAARWIPR